MRVRRRQPPPCVSATNGRHGVSYMASPGVHRSEWKLRTGRDDRGGSVQAWLAHQNLKTRVQGSSAHPRVRSLATADSGTGTKSDRQCKALLGWNPPRKVAAHRPMTSASRAFRLATRALPPWESGTGIDASVDASSFLAPASKTARIPPASYPPNPKDQGQFQLAPL